MMEIRFHGRAGQGIVTAAELIADAAAMEGKYSQAMPFFGSEKRGPPVTSYLRIDTKPITIHEEIVAPDLVIVAEPSVVHEVQVDAGLKMNGKLILNSPHTHEQVKASGVVNGHHLEVVNGTEIALKHLGKPITNTVMLGALCKLTDVVKLESVIKAIERRFPEKLAKPNIEAIKECYNSTKAN